MGATGIVACTAAALADKSCGAEDKKKHYIHHLLVIFKKHGDKDNSGPGWCDYAAE